MKFQFTQEKDSNNSLFGCLKSKGFGFEETHITRPERIEKLIAVLTITFCWAHKIGEWRHQEVGHEKLSRTEIFLLTNNYSHFQFKISGISWPCWSI